MKAQDHVVLGVGDTHLELRSPEPADASRPVEYLTVTLCAPGLQATSRIDAYLSEGLPRLFEDMAANWRGWRGKKAWESIDHDLRLTASHDGHGHISVAVCLRSYVPNEDMWTAEGTLTLEPGSLDELASAIRRLLRQ
jgi:hypothetical protein